MPVDGFKQPAAPSLAARSIAAIAEYGGPVKSCPTPVELAQLTHASASMKTTRATGPYLCIDHINHITITIMSTGCFRIVPTFYMPWMILKRDYGAPIYLPVTLLLTSCGQPNFGAIASVGVACALALLLASCSCSCSYTQQQSSAALALGFP